MKIRLNQNRYYMHTLAVSSSLVSRLRMSSDWSSARSAAAPIFEDQECVKTEDDGGSEGEELKRIA